jgi:hypothetical protein
VASFRACLQKSPGNNRPRLQLSLAAALPLSYESVHVTVMPIRQESNLRPADYEVTVTLATGEFFVRFTLLSTQVFRRGTSGCA